MIRNLPEYNAMVILVSDIFVLYIHRFGKMVACFRYAPISVHSVHLPPHKLDFGHQPLDWIQKEANEVCNLSS
jgi:hypothetical protein